MSRPNNRGAAPPGRVRIIGGQWRNSRVLVPELDGLRPTPERVRETLFNWLAPVLAGARCLDLCAGTGALGLEALSRGASAVRFVESVPAVAGALRANLERLHASGGAVSVLAAQDFLSGTAEQFDLVFIDPPFAQALWGTLAHLLERGGWLSDAAMIYVESPPGLDLQLPASWIVHRVGVAGVVRHALYRRERASA